MKVLPGLLLCFIILGVTLKAVPAAAAPNFQGSGVTAYDLIVAMNSLRVGNGLSPLIEDPIVNAVAQVTAETMAANEMSWHIGDVRGRLAAAGYGQGATVWATENFAVGFSMDLSQIMQAWSDPDHMRPATIPAYCHVGAGVATAPSGKIYYILQAAYTSENACGPYTYSGGTGSTGSTTGGVSGGVIIPVAVATPDEDGLVYHIVKPGQTFWAIAIAYQITIADIEYWNNLSRLNPLLIGQRLLIPGEGTEGFATPTPVGFVLPAEPDEEGRIIHTVEAYQTLIRISNAYSVPVDRILALNGWQLEWPLQIGQKLLIDPGHFTPSPTPRPLTAIEKLTPAGDGNYYHTVLSGETLIGIANLYDISVSSLMAWNGLNGSSIIRPDQQLLLRVTPPATATPSPLPATNTPVPGTTGKPGQPAATVSLTPTPASPGASPTTTDTLLPEAGSGRSPALIVGLALSIIGVAVLVGILIRKQTF